ncbi:MAG: hypothetical protein KZY74_04785 [Paenibacillaceae bacterium]|uniref:Polysaccharide deacetylase n=1 Tax=Paenibacillus mellifer TaxID=2937794 RepID=A0A9X1XZN8_9BACL|nr:hypothetical protein [Paenibacillus mellifer]MBW4838690.1 hypothetical protein [Paenibacillaceae bacterium]MCK8486881.1 hypothetical protein [Paenibacillus mellifer]
MNRVKNKAVLLLLAICLTLASGVSSPVHAEEQKTKAIWAWDFYEAASNSNKITVLLKFLKEQDINLLFIGTSKTLPDQPATYEELILRAHEEGIRVFALVGRAEWALEGRHREALAELEQVLSFNETHPASVFDGIQYDIEPHTLAEYKTKRGSVNYQYIQVLKKIAHEIKASGDPLEFNAAIPCWYASGEKPVIVETGGQRKPLSYFVLDIVDTASLMAYRDTAERQIRASLAEADYAAKLGKKVYVGAETSAPNGSTIPNEITYYNKGSVYMNKQIKAINAYYARHEGFGGVAIHQYPAFKKLMQGR